MMDEHLLLNAERFDCWASALVRHPIIIVCIHSTQQIPIAEGQ